MARAAENYSSKLLIYKGIDRVALWWWRSIGTVGCAIGHKWPCRRRATVSAQSEAVKGARSFVAPQLN